MVVLILAGLLGFGPGPERVFSAVMQPTAVAPAALSSAEGAANIRVDDAALRYRIQLARLKDVTNVVLEDGLVVVPLVRGPLAGGKPVIQTRGEIRARDMKGLALSRLASDMAAGHVSVVVFTKEEPGGVIRGQVYPGRPPLGTLEDLPAEQ